LLDAAVNVAQNAAMDSDEREIYEYLKTWGEDYVSAKEICRRASTKKRYAEDNNWARPILQRMKERNLIDGDALGRYRIKPDLKKGHKGRWVSPDIEKILKDGGVQIDGEHEETSSGEPDEQP
jgi:hypothetical protein